MFRCFVWGFVAKHQTVLTTNLLTKGILVSKNTHSRNFEVKLTIPHLTIDGLRAAHELAGFTIIHEKNGQKIPLRPDQVTPEIIASEIDDILKMNQTEQKAALQSLVVGMIELAKNSVGIANWAIQADAFLHTIPAKFQALEGADIKSVRPLDDSET